MPVTARKKLDSGNLQLKDQVVSINRVTKVVKGGKNLSFAALVVVGDPDRLESIGIFNHLVLLSTVLFVTYLFE